jgi:hypothetical protein
MSYHVFARDTGKYLAVDGQWVAEQSDAIAFASFDDAEACLPHHYLTPHASREGISQLIVVASGEMPSQDT